MARCSHSQSPIRCTSACASCAGLQEFVYLRSKLDSCLTGAMLASAGLTEADVKPVLVPNVVRSADEFMAGNSDMFSFAFGGPKVKEADVTVGGIRALEDLFKEAEKIIAPPPSESFVWLCKLP